MRPDLLHSSFLLLLLIWEATLKACGALHNLARYREILNISHRLIDISTFLEGLYSGGLRSKGILCLYLKYITLKEEIFAGRKFREFREFWPNSRK